jgi:hypothetical protein
MVRQSSAHPRGPGPPRGGNVLGYPRAAGGTLGSQIGEGVPPWTKHRKELGDNGTENEIRTRAPLYHGVSPNTFKNWYRKIGFPTAV